MLIKRWKEYILFCPNNNDSNNNNNMFLSLFDQPCFSSFLFVTHSLMHTHALAHAFTHALVINFVPRVSHYDPARISLEVLVLTYFPAYLGANSNNSKWQTIRRICGYHTLDKCAPSEESCLLTKEGVILSLLVQ